MGKLLGKGGQLFTFTARRKERNLLVQEEQADRQVLQRCCCCCRGYLRLLCSAAPAPCAPAPLPSSPAPPAASAGWPEQQQLWPETGAGSCEKPWKPPASSHPTWPPHLRARLRGRLQHCRLIRGAGARQVVGGQTLLRWIHREGEKEEGSRREWRAKRLTVWKGLYWSTASMLELVTWVTEGS